MKNEGLLEKWEKVVKKVRNDGNGWRATKYSFICSKHFEKDDYIKLPTAETGSCRLKRNAIPSLFKIEQFPNHILEEASRRLQTECNKIPAYTGRKTSQAAGYHTAGKSAHKQKLSESFQNRKPQARNNQKANEIKNKKLTATTASM